MIKPSIGRIVLFFRSGVDYASGVEQPYAAQVAYVHSDSLINIGVLSAAGQSFGRTSVPLIQEGEKIPEAGDYCTWMPYQIQAAKVPLAEPPKA